MLAKINRQILPHVKAIIGSNEAKGTTVLSRQQFIDGFFKKLIGCTGKELVLEYIVLTYRPFILKEIEEKNDQKFLNIINNELVVETKLMLLLF